MTDQNLSSSLALRDKSTEDAFEVLVNRLGKEGVFLNISRRGAMQLFEVGPSHKGCEKSMEEQTSFVFGKKIDSNLHGELESLFVRVSSKDADFFMKDPVSFASLVLMISSGQGGPLDDFFSSGVSDFRTFYNPKIDDIIAEIRKRKTEFLANLLVTLHVEKVNRWFESVPSGLRQEELTYKEAQRLAKGIEQRFILGKILETSCFDNKVSKAAEKDLKERYGESAGRLRHCAYLVVFFGTLRRICVKRGRMLPHFDRSLRDSERGGA